MEISQQLKEILSWRLVSETVRRAPDRLRIFELHPGGGQYDCLALYTVDGDSLAHLNRLGRFHPFGKLRDIGGVAPSEEEPWDIWRDAFSVEDQSKNVDGICRRIGLTIPAKLPASTPVVVVYRFIAEFLARTAFDRSRWECLSGFLDSSGFLGCSTRTELFAAFPDADERLQVRTDDDSPENAAYRFWFIMRNSEPVLCLETTGTIWNLAGDSLDIPKAYHEHRRLWPLITEIAGDLLP